MRKSIDFSYKYFQMAYSREITINDAREKMRARGSGNWICCNNFFLRSQLLISVSENDTIISSTISIFIILWCMYTYVICMYVIDLLLEYVTVDTSGCKLFIIIPLIRSEIVRSSWNRLIVQVTVLWFIPSTFAIPHSVYFISTT